MILNAAKNKTKSADLGSKNGPPKNLAPPSADSTYESLTGSGLVTQQRHLAGFVCTFINVLSHRAPGHCQ